MDDFLGDPVFPERRNDAPVERMIAPRVRADFRGATSRAPSPAERPKMRAAPSFHSRTIPSSVT